ncbi:MAG TPA: alpha-amylase family glycosyl hydrolase [Enterovirga sp.]
MQIPAPEAQALEIRYASLLDRDMFDRSRWQMSALARSQRPGWWEFDPEALNLPDGDYEYEFIRDGRAGAPIPDPYAEEITRFDGYRGVFRLREGRRWRPRFRWDDELPAGSSLPENNKIVIYEMPLRWMSAGGEEIRQVDLGTFDDAIFQRLDELVALGVNAIELLPIQDSPDTLNWGYGSRFFFAPDFDMGTPVDAKLFIKRCHQRGIRVILDVVMNHARNCPLADLAFDWFFLKDGNEEGGRNGWGGTLFRYRRPAADGSHPAREFHCAMAEFWIENYHVDGFRIDEFQGIGNWEFIQQFRERAWAKHRALFPDRPFIVIAEDSWRRAAATQDRPENPNGRKVVDAIWGFAFRDDARRLLQDRLATQWGQPSRRQRIADLISGRAEWDEYGHAAQPGFEDLSQVVPYLTSHDVEQPGEARLMNFLFGAMLREAGRGDGSVQNVRGMVDSIEHQPDDLKALHARALDGVRGGFALLMTSFGMPMFLAGEEFADVHDLEHGDYRLKMSDPVNWGRLGVPGHRALRDAVGDLIRLRTSHPALQRDEMDLFYSHPEIDQDGGVRVFAYCRDAARPLGSPGQVVVVANAGPHDFASYDMPWPWAGTGALTTERGGPAAAGAFRTSDGHASLSLAPFQIRVFAT